MPPPVGHGARRSPAEFSSRKRRLRSAAAFLFASPSPRAPETPDIVDRAGKPSDWTADGDEPDPEYELFLRHLRADGQAYVFEMAVGVSDSVRYEMVDDYGEAMQQEHHQKYKRGRGGNDVQKTKICEANKRHNMKAASLVINGDVSDRRSCCPPAKKADVRSSMIDDDYQIFLNYLREHQGSPMLQCDNNVTVIYEEEKSSVDVHEEERENDMEEGKKVAEEDDYDDVMIVEPEEMRKESNACSSVMELEPFYCSSQPSVSLELQTLEVSDFVQVLASKVPSPFNSRLMSVLDKPFDPKELDDLMALASARKFIVKYTHLRKESIPYETDQIGYSYLDHYPDLARKVESADDQNALTLLRGFFFWLKNIGHDGAYMPWRTALSNYVTV